MKFSSQKIRKDFIDFFAAKSSKFINSFYVFPSDDPTLLFKNVMDESV